MAVSDITVKVHLRYSKWRIHLVKAVLTLLEPGVAGIVWDWLKPIAMKVKQQPWHAITWQRIQESHADGNRR